MDKLELADPSFALVNQQLPIPHNPLPEMKSLKVKKKKLKPADLLDLDMDNLDEELQRLGVDPNPVPDTLKKKIKVPTFAMDVLRRRLEGSRMKEPMYDEDGCPVLPDGSSRPFTLQEMKKLYQQSQARLFREKPKPKYTNPVKKKIRKNPPPRKVDIEALFREERARQEALKKFD